MKSATIFALQVESIDDAASRTQSVHESDTSGDSYHRQHIRSSEIFRTNDGYVSDDTDAGERASGGF